MSDQIRTAERSTADAPSELSPADRRRRGQAVLGAIAGVVVVLALVAVLVGMRLAGGTPPAEPAAAPAPSAGASSGPAAEPSPAAQPQQNPQQAPTPAALRQRPVVKAGTGKLSALKVTYLVKGTGPKVRTGQTVTTNYVLVNYRTGQVIDTSWDRGQVFPYQAGAGNIIKGWDQGLMGVPVGSRVRLDVPAAMAYGADPGDLRFVVDVLAAS